MTSGDAEINQLIQATRASLAPAPFPPRRDLSCAGAATRSAGGDVLFHDVFWVRQRQICCYAARLPGGGRHDGAEGRSMAAAHALKALMRAAMQRHGAGEAIAMSLEAMRAMGLAAADIDVAAAALRIDTGEASLAAVGAGAAVRLAPGTDAVDAGSSGSRVQCGQLLWLAVGAVASPVLVEQDVSPDAEELIRAALDGAEGAAVAVGLRTVHRERGQIITLDNDVAQIGLVLAEIDSYLAAQDVGEEARAGLDVALDEILTNIVLYAYDDGQAHEIILHVMLSGSALRIEVRDDGTPFDPTAAPSVDTTGDLDDRPVGGLGLHFMRTVFDEVSYNRQRGWNLLTLCKRLRGVAGAQRIPAALPTGMDVE